MPLTRSLLACVALLPVLIACSIDPRAYETEPVTVDTPKGVVTCQLYKPKQVLWDRAIDAPVGMSIKEADNYCIAEGSRRAKG